MVYPVDRKVAFGLSTKTNQMYWYYSNLSYQ